MGKLIQALVPPVLWSASQSLMRRGKNNGELFDGNDAEFKRCLRNATVYGEYGVGQSTSWVYNNTNLDIIAVDSSLKWIEGVQSGKSAERAKLVWIDVGRVGQWGQPVDYSCRHNFHSYVESIWIYPNKPDLILVDGRFRVACFLYSLLNASPGSVIIFDDYSERRHYHVVEEFINPVRTNGRQASFEVPSTLDKSSISRACSEFMLVMD